MASASKGTLKGLVRHTTHVARIKHEEETTIAFSHAYQGRVCPELNYLSGEYTNRSNPPIQAATLVTTDSKADKHPPATFNQRHTERERKFSSQERYFQVLVHRYPGTSNTYPTKL